MTYDTIIIGAGPAGLTAAIYTGRNRLKTLVLSKDLGGQTALSGEVENYPGFAFTSGTELIQKFLDQAKKQSGVEVNISPEFAVKSIQKGKDGYIVVDNNDRSYITHTIIVTAGKNPKKLGIEGEDKFAGRGVSYCATCDGPFFKEKTVAVIGGGYSATEAAYMLLKYAKKVYIINIGEKLNGEAVTLNKITNSEKLTVIPNAHTSQVLNDDSKVTGLEYKDSKTGETKSIKVDGIFVEIGSVPNTKIFDNLLKLNQWNEIEIDNNNSTKMPGVFAAGDITNVWGKQIVIAAGEGAKAAMAVGEYLSKLKNT